MKSAECNERYFAKTGYGFGSVMSNPDHVKALRSLTKEQIEALLNMILLGDIYEVGEDKLILGAFSPSQDQDRESEILTQMAASLVYLSGHLAEDFELLRNKNEEND